MRSGWLVLGIAVGIAFAVTPAPAQQPPALTGQVTSAKDGPMEGVLVSAKRCALDPTSATNARSIFKMSTGNCARYPSEE